MATKLLTHTHTHTHTHECVMNSPIDLVVERKNFKLLFSAGIVLVFGVLNLYISSNENDWCHSAWVTSLGNIKAVYCSLNLFSSSFASSRTDQSSQGESILSLFLLPKPIPAADWWTFSSQESTFSLWLFSTIPAAVAHSTFGPVFL